MKTHDKKGGHDRSKISSSDEKVKGTILNFTASADIYPSGGSSSSDTDSMLFDNNANMLQFHIVDGNGNNIKYSAPVLNYVTSPQPNPPMMIEHSNNEAIQMSMASEVEVDSQWVDISVLANKSVIPSTPVTSSCVALSTAIPTYVNLPTYQNDIISTYFNGNSSGNDDQTMKDLNDLLLTNGFESESKTLKSITADAGICQCTNCKCDPMQENGCIGGCGPEKPCRGPTASKPEQSSQMEIDTKRLIEEIDSLNVDTTKPQAPASACDCKNTKDAVDKGCCVVICLKTLETVNADKEHGCGRGKPKLEMNVPILCSTSFGA